MNPRQVLTLFRHEVRCALRERNIVIFSIVLPLVMYPGMLWAMFAGMAFVDGQADRMDSRVAILDPGEQTSPSLTWEAHTTLLDSLEGHPRIGLQDVDQREVALELLAGGRLDAMVELVPAKEDGRSLPENFTLRVSFNEARDRSEDARGRVEEVTASYREEWIDGSRRELGVSDAIWADFVTVRNDTASQEDIARFILGLMVPFLMLITVALAAFYPAIDATAGERERSTWETLMTVAAPPGAVAAGKYLYVATFGAMGGLLNLFALALSMQWILRPLAGSDAEALATGGIPLSALPVIAMGTALLGLFVAAGMLVFAVFARTFKEGQSMVMPFYLIIIMPAVFLQSPDTEFTVGLALIPAVNVVMLIREAILGTLDPLLAVTTLGSMTVVVVLSVAFVQWVMSREEVLLGSGEGGLFVFLKQKLSSGNVSRRTP
ncbi:MAG: ABC transporter permease [Gemmatimonadota bacterium]